MPASYPTAVKSFTTKVAAQTIDASHVNDLQAEITAMQTDLLTTFPGGTNGAPFNWTPAITFSTPGNLAVVYSTQIGKGLKIGRLVQLWATIVTSTFTHTTASGSLVMTGNPHTATNSSGLSMGGSVVWQGITKANYTHIVPSVPASATNILFTGSGSGQNNSNIDATDMPSAGSVQLVVSLSFLTDS